MEELIAEPEVVITDRLNALMQTFLAKECENKRLKEEIEKHSNANNIPFRLIKEIRDVISESGA